MNSTVLEGHDLVTCSMTGRSIYKILLCVKHLAIKGGMILKVINFQIHCSI